MAYSKSFANGKPIDHQAWAENQIAKRTRAALEARDAALVMRSYRKNIPRILSPEKEYEIVESTTVTML